jgi:O-antigen ligase
MPEHLRALVVVLFLATVVCVYAKAPACAIAIDPRDFRRRRNLWFALTLLLFLCGGFWIYMVGAALILLLASSADRNRLALYFFLLFAMPPVLAQIGGLGLIEQLFEINHVRLLALSVLLPAFMRLATRPDRLRFGSIWPDRFLLGYLVVSFGVMLSVATFTNVLRHGVFYAFIDIVLPYYVASRGLRDLQAFRDALMSFVVAALLLSAVAVFETGKHWMLYSAVVGALDVDWNYGNYLPRGDLALRAQATTGQPIALGFVVCVALGFWLHARRLVPNALARRAATALLVAGLLASLSRGPWLGAAALVTAFVATGTGSLRQVAKMGTVALLALPFAATSPRLVGALQWLPLFGSVELGNVAYRAQLLDIALGEIWKSPWFGGLDIYSAARTESLRQNYGTFIDVVNTYVAIMLTSGLVGLTLFASFFAAAGHALYKAALHTSQDDEHRDLGRALVATLFAALVMIFTVSSITVIPTVYWCLAGLAVGYANALACRPQAGRVAAVAPIGQVERLGERLRAGSA